MTVEELLKPRFEIIADFPNNHYGEVGTILDRNWSRHPNDDETQPPIWSLSDFPHLFKLLNWWEKREESEMPTYLKHSIDYGASYTFHKIEKWDMKTLFGFENVAERSGCGLLSWSPKFTYQPATEQEYLESLQNQAA